MSRLLLLMSAAVSSLLTGLVAHWRLNEASGTRFDAVGPNHLTDTNTVTQTTGKVGEAAQFTAVNLEYLSAADSAELSAGDFDFTWAVWVWLDSKGANRTILVKGTANTTAGLEYRLYYDSASDRFSWGVGNGTTFLTVNASTLGSPATGTWYFVVCWHDASANQIGIQVNDGAADTTAFSAGSQDTGGNFRVGARVDTTSLMWDGRIDALSFWKRLLTALEKTSLYNGGAGRDYPFS